MSLMNVKKDSDGDCICQTCDTDELQYGGYSCKTCYQSKNMCGESYSGELYDKYMRQSAMKCGKCYQNIWSLDLNGKGSTFCRNDLCENFVDDNTIKSLITKLGGEEKLNKDGTGTANARRGIDPNNKKHVVMKFDYVSQSGCDICAYYDGMTFGRDSPNRPVIPRLEKGDGERPYTHPNCYSNDTEVYTDQGWKLFNDLNRTEKMLSLNPDNEDMEWVKPIEWVSFKSDKMIHFKNKWNDILVTPDHNMVIRGWKDRIKFKPAKECKSRVIPRSSKWIGKDMKIIKIDDLKIDAKTFCKFMGYWLSEGSVTHRHKNTEQIAIAQHKTGQLQIIFDEISNIPMKVCMGKSQLYIFNQSLGVYLHQFGKSYQKFIPNIIKEMSPELIRLFLDAYMFGDGSRGKPKTGFKGIPYTNESRQYFTSSKRMADDIGELILKVGKVPKFNFENRKGKMVKFKNGIYETKTDMWRVKENHTKTSSMNRMNINEIEYNDMVYCVELPKFHTLYVRRNGQCSWSGNCKCRWNKVFNEVSVNEGMEMNPELIERAKALYGSGRQFDSMSTTERNMYIIRMLRKDLGMEFLEGMMDPVPLASMAVMTFNAIKDPVRMRLHKGESKVKGNEADSPYRIQPMLDAIVAKSLGKEDKEDIEEKVSGDFTLDNLLNLVADKLAKKAAKKMGLESMANESCYICDGAYPSDDHTSEQHEYELEDMPDDIKADFYKNRDEKRMKNGKESMANELEFSTIDSFIKKYYIMKNGNILDTIHGSYNDALDLLHSLGGDKIHDDWYFKTNESRKVKASEGYPNEQNFEFWDHIQEFWCNKCGTTFGADEKDDMKRHHEAHLSYGESVAKEWSSYDENDYKVVSPDILTDDKKILDGEGLDDDCGDGFTKDPKTGNCMSITEWNERAKRLTDAQGQYYFTCSCGEKFETMNDPLDGAWTHINDQGNYQGDYDHHIVKEGYANEGGKGSGKKGHQRWMLGVLATEICKTCMVSTEWEGTICDMCGNDSKQSI